MKIEKTTVELIKDINALSETDKPGNIMNHSNIIIGYYYTDAHEDIEYVYEWLLARKGITCTNINITVEKEDCDDDRYPNFFIMMSGNGSEWEKYLKRDIRSEFIIDDEDHIKNIYMVLHNNYPQMFTDDAQEPWKYTEIKIFTESDAAKINIIHTSYTFKVFASGRAERQFLKYGFLSFGYRENAIEDNYANVTFIKPAIDENSPNYIAWEDMCSRAENVYDGFVDDGISPEISIDILPYCTSVEFYVTGHYNEWQKFIEDYSEEYDGEEEISILNKIDKEIKKCYIY